METLLIILIVVIAPIILFLILYFLFSAPSVKCKYCDKKLKEEEVVIYKGVSCAECKEKNKIIDSLDKPPRRFGIN